MSKLTRKVKRQKQEAKADKKESQKVELLAYLGAYGEPESIQPTSAAAFDSQIKNISASLATGIASSPQGTILDIGCGRGVLLQRLVKIDAFDLKKGWIYFGADFEENVSEVMKLAFDLGVHRRVDATTLDKFYASWPQLDIAPKPYLVVIRNVFHELDIEKTANLLHHIAQHLDPDDSIIVQDLQLFPISERGNACWLPKQFSDLLGDVGIENVFIEEPTAKGNRWFTVLGHKRATAERVLSIAETRDAVVARRKKQYDFWMSLGWLTPEDEKFREVQIAKLDFDLQCAALQQQLLKAEAKDVPPPSRHQQAQILRKTFSKHLETFNFLQGQDSANLLIQMNPFRDRAYHQDTIEKFLREEKIVAVVYGNPLAGKTALVREVLAKRSYEKLVVFLDVQMTSSVWNFLEQLLSGIGCKFGADLYGSLREIKFEDIRNEVQSFLNRICGQIILAIDHFERLLNPRSQVQDREIRDLLTLLANAANSKILITTRNAPVLDFIESEKVFIFDERPLGRFPEGNHVENVLNDFVNLGELGISTYPAELLQAIDRHPFLTVLAGMTIRKEGKGALIAPEFLARLRHNLRDALFRNLVDPASRKAIDVLSLLRVPIPRQMLQELAGNGSVLAAEEAGLIYSVFDRTRTDLIAGLGAIQRRRSNLDDLSLTDEFDDSTIQDELNKEHQRIGDWYERLYRIDYDPRWIRELHYHRFSTGDPKSLEKFGALYKTEIFWAGDYWYRILKKFDSALWAFDLAKGLGLITVQSEMRRASCLMRVKQPGGEELFKDLIQEYPDAPRIKNAYIDSLLYLSRYGDALDKLHEYELAENENGWVAREYGRAYFGLHKYGPAARVFEYQLSLEKTPEALAYDNLARAYRLLGDSKNEIKTVTAGLNRYPTSARLRLRKASHLVRAGAHDSLVEADAILSELYADRPSDGRILQQYCKLLCATDRSGEAEKIWLNVKDKIIPVEYRDSIHVEILIQKERWDEALEALKNASLNNEHLIGMKKEVFLAWAKKERNTEARIVIAKQGLNVEVGIALSNNIPLLITSARLARIAGEDTRYEDMARRIGQISPETAEVLRRDDNMLAPYWDGS